MGTENLPIELAAGSHETVGAGEVYYWPEGLTADTDDDVVFLEFGLRQFSDHAKCVLG